MSDQLAFEICTVSFLFFSRLAYDGAELLDYIIYIIRLPLMRLPGSYPLRFLQIGMDT